MLLLELVQAQKDPTAGEEERRIEQKEKDGVSSSLRFEMHVFFFCKNVRVGAFKITLCSSLSLQTGETRACVTLGQAVCLSAYVPCLPCTSFVSGGTASHRHGLILRNLQSGKGDRC